MATLSPTTSAPSSGWINAQSIYKTGLISNSSITITCLTSVKLHMPWAYLMQYFNQILFRKDLFNPKDFFQTFNWCIFSFSIASSLNFSIHSRILISAASFSAAEPIIFTVHVSGSLSSFKVIVVPVEIWIPIIFFPSFPIKPPC